MEVFKMEIDILVELRKENEAFNKFTIKMGLTPESNPRQPFIKQDFIVVGGNGQPKQIEGQPKNPELTGPIIYTLEQINNMPPAEREKLRTRLYKEIMLQSLENQKQEEQQAAPTVEVIK
jgi:hypothetical protein